MIKCNLIDGNDRKFWLILDVVLKVECICQKKNDIQCIFLSQTWLNCESFQKHWISYELFENYQCNLLFQWKAISLVEIKIV